METKGIAAGLALTFVVIGAGSSEADGRLEGRFEFSGTFINSDFDVNKDGLKAGDNLEGIKGGLGPGQLRAVVEFVFDPDAKCPDGSNGFTLVTKDASGDPVVPWQAVVRLERSGDLILAEYAAATSCFDPSTAMQTFTNDLVVTGGTGRFEGATGVVLCEGTALTTLFDADGNYFGAQDGRCEFRVDLEDRDDDEDDDDD